MRALRIVVSVGTDHHRFDRLVDWTERWIAASGLRVELFVQHGASRPPSLGEGVPMLARDEMLVRYRTADVVITQVGPGSILDVAEVGRIPIVVARRPDLHEHVDGHQIVFGRFMAQQGEAVLAEDEAAFRAAITRAVVRPAVTRRDPRRPAVNATARALSAVVEDVMSRPAGFIDWSRLRLRMPFRPQVLPRRPVAARVTRVPTPPSSAPATQELQSAH